MSAVEEGPKERPATYLLGSGFGDALVSRCRTVNRLMTLESTYSLKQFLNGVESQRQSTCITELYRVYVCKLGIKGSSIL